MTATAVRSGPAAERASELPGARSVRYARVAGAMYLLIMILSMLNVSVVDAKLIAPESFAITSSNVAANDFLFRLGMAGSLVLYASVIVLSWALYVVLEPVNRPLAMLAMLLRVAEGILGAVTVFFSFVALRLLEGMPDATVVEVAPLRVLSVAFLDLRAATLDVVLVFVGLGGSLFCYLFFAARTVPRMLAGWGVFTYLSMLGLAFVSILVPDHPVLFETVLYGLGGLFEVVFGLWLVFQGVTPPREHPESV